MEQARCTHETAVAKPTGTEFPEQRKETQKEIDRLQQRLDSFLETSAHADAEVENAETDNPQAWTNRFFSRTVEASFFSQIFLLRLAIGGRITTLC